MARPPLSKAELRTLAALPSHRTLAELANELFLSVNTVKFHLRSIYRKLGVSDRNEAVERAKLMGLVSHANERAA